MASVRTMAGAVRLPRLEQRGADQDGEAGTEQNAAQGGGQVGAEQQGESDQREPAQAAERGVQGEGGPAIGERGEEVAHVTPP